MFTVLQGRKKAKPDYAGLHIRALMRLLEENKQGEVYISSVIYHGVKYLIHSDITGLDYSGLMKRLEFTEQIKAIMQTLTPRELMQVFPPKKDYDGGKRQCKDYYFTMQAMREHGLNKPIGREIGSILWDYMNNDLMNFVCGELSLISAMRRLEGKPGLMEKFAEDNGLTVYRKYVDITGKEFMQNGTTGEVHRVHKKRPRYMRVVE
ncbi:hypothetical protein [Sporomusa sphaeroides]|uniref:Uncharacterized protein n=1 Tax=Sporomusa sphaeroides DSM 2875 TaxID=1337886 RepID=A0ABM9VYI7_9FIRM|nr:hypothetical protein [Sporomusa sphaeroides]OLS58269.1 hypothetical protein SPSPH_18050 [Sporomusa sphaeroides DSM 2875]CVK17544.1 hypothetical protein SSPH_00178 [Sporomusa sphaeroides DSM 2875]